MSIDSVIKYLDSLSNILGLEYEINTTICNDFEVEFSKENIRIQTLINGTLPEKHIKYKLKKIAFLVLEQLVENKTKGIK